jgi:hypothetical protein
MVVFSACRERQKTTQSTPPLEWKANDLVNGVNDRTLISGIAWTTQH